jgi:hypothetical protein
MIEFETNDALIAEFMNLQKVQQGKWKQIDHKFTWVERDHLSHPILKYSTSYDWLMPVLEKMYDIGYSTDINSGNRRIWIHRNDIGLMADEPDYNEEFRGNKSYAHDLTAHQCLYIAVLEFIKWYNDNGKKK